MEEGQEDAPTCGKIERKPKGSGRNEHSKRFLAIICVDNSCFLHFSIYRSVFLREKKQ